MKSLRDLLAAVLVECGQRCGTSTSRDILYVDRRIKDEGESSFLSITLGNFCDDFERSLSQGCVESQRFLGFRRGSGCLPAFLQGFTTQVFDSSGIIFDQPSIDAIRSIRQICRMFKKVSLPCSSDRVRAAFDGYVEVENELASWSPDNIDETLWNIFQRVSDVLFSTLEPPKEFPVCHGTGAVANRLTNFRKYRPAKPYWYHRLDSSFPACDYFMRSITAWIDEGEKVEFVSLEHELPVKVITVPKTLKGPRIIAMEPDVVQLCQQGVLRWLVPRIESDRLFRSVRFTDQSVNARLALLSSRDCNLATLDLKEASDRVHKDVVYNMLRSQPVLRDAIFACRTATSKLPDGKTLPLQKFASMGSALCFPMEALTFYVVILAAMHKADGTAITQRSILRYARDISIYGDDIIIPVYRVPSVVDALQAFRLKVNATKSFWTGKFRESCGEDAYDGHRVTPVYVREPLPTKRRNVKSVLSYVSLMWQLYNSGYIRSAYLIHEYLSENLGIFLAHGDDKSPYLSSPFTQKVTKRWNADLHAHEVKCVISVVSGPAIVLDGWSAWSRFFDLRVRSDGEINPPSSIAETQGSLEVSDGRTTIALKTSWSRW